MFSSNSLFFFPTVSLKLIQRFTDLWFIHALDGSLLVTRVFLCFSQNYKHWGKYKINSANFSLMRGENFINISGLRERLGPEVTLFLDVVWLILYIYFNMFIKFHDMKELREDHSFREIKYFRGYPITFQYRQCSWSWSSWLFYLP